MVKRILVVLKEEPLARVAASEGTALAVSHGAELVFMALTPDQPVQMADVGGLGVIAPADESQASIAATERLVADAMAQAEAAGVFAQKIIAREPVVAQTVIDAAKRRRCDMILVATDEHNAVVRLLIGSLVPGLITASPMPVMICKPPRSPQAQPA